MRLSTLLPATLVAIALFLSPTAEGNPAASSETSAGTLAPGTAQESFSVVTDKEERRALAEFMKRRLKWRGKHSWRHPRLSLRNSSALEAGRPFLVEGGHAFAEVLGQLAQGVLVDVHEAGHLIEGA